MAIQDTIQNYLDAVEQKFGKEARKNTVLKHREGTDFVLKRADSAKPTLVDMETVQLMTGYLKKYV